MNNIRTFFHPKITSFFLITCGMFRYFIVVDDIWDTSVWKRIRCALPDNDVGYTIITTIYLPDVVEQAGSAYNTKPPFI